jgi:LmbE family N-acetylglucosaminyl deacetylase
LPLLPANYNPLSMKNGHIGLHGLMENVRPARRDAGAMTGEDASPPLTSQRTALKKYLMRTLSLALLALLSAISVPIQAQAPADRPSPVDPLPPDTGAAGLKGMLLRLQTTTRLMQTTAHPDDEDGGMLTLESRGKGVSTLLMTLTRGEGGQNKVGSNLFDVLGVLRTLELTASDRYYGVEQRFSRAADFGYSKNPDEAFQKWGGHEIPLGDMVRVIRTFRPDVLVARFSGTDRDGHGHHQASAILTKEAFRAAADPKRFPEQMKEGLQPWQAKKLYIGNVCGFGATSCPPENYTVKLNTGHVNPLLGMSYIQFAMEGLRHQLSQGAGGWSVDPGDRFTFYKLVDSVIPSATDNDGHEKDFFDGIDTGLGTLISPSDAPARKELAEVEANIAEAAKDAEKDPGSAAAPLFSVVESLGRLEARLRGGNNPDQLARLQEKESQARTALNLALNLSIQASLVTPQAPKSPLTPAEDPLAAISPGQKIIVRVQLHNGSSHALQLRSLFLEGQVDDSEQKEHIPPVQPGKDYQTDFHLDLPLNTPPTRPALHRNDPERDGVYTVDQPQYQALPFLPPPFRVSAHYDVPDLASRSRGIPSKTPETLPEISAPVLVAFTDEHGTEQKRYLSVVPAFSVELEPGEQIVPIANGSERTVKVGVSSNLTGVSSGSLKLEAPPGWRIEPKEIPVELRERGDKKDFEFKVVPGSLKEGRTQIRAVLSSGGKNYSEGYSFVTREDLASAYYYQPALQRVSIVDVKVPKDLKVAYIPGAGDEIPTVLQQIGIDVAVLPAEKVAGADLAQYGTIVLGIRAYDTQKDVATNNKKLLDYVSSGGTLIVQYNAGTGDFNSGHFTPFPATLSRSRVSVEEAPVEILAPEDSVFHYPNQITQRDFEGWVQERGLYFMDQWDGNFRPLLSSHDPGESALKGGLLRAQYGKGTYIFAAYAFFRQLPAGVPGAIRLYVNLLGAGHESSH